MRKMYTIKSAAEAINVNPKTLRRWEKKGLISPQRTVGNQRRFNDHDLEKLKNIKAGNLLSVSEISQKFGVVPQTAQRWLKQGKLPLELPNPTSPPHQAAAWKPYIVYASLIALVIGLINTGYLYLKNREKIVSPSINELQLDQAGLQIALPAVANFLNGQITIGSDTGTLSFLDHKGNLYLKNTALIQGGVATNAIQFLPSDPPEPQLGRQYLDKNTGQLMYYDGIDWVALTKSSSSSAKYQSNFLTEDLNLTLGDLTASDSAASIRLTLAGPQSQFIVLGGANQEIMTLNDDSSFPVIFSQPTKVMANFYASKMVDADSDDYFIDPSSTSLSLNLAGNATLSATLKFSQYGDYLTNSVNNYLVFSGGLGVGGSTSYGFNSSGNLNAHKIEADDEIRIDNLKLYDNNIVATNDQGVSILDRSGNGLQIKDGGDVYIKGTKLEVPDYVFDAGYELLSPISLEEFIRIHGHLPKVDSRQTIQNQGFNLSRFSLQLLEQIENNVLYILDLNKRVARVEQLLIPLALNPDSPAPEPSPVPSPSPSPSPLPIPAPSLDPLVLANATELTASASGYLELDTINLNAGFFKDYLAVLGQASITDLTVTNSLTLTSLNPLEGRLNLLSGLMTLDQSGEVVINGNLKVNGTIIAQEISPAPQENLNISIASGSAVLIYQDINQPIASFSSQSAQFNQLEILNSGTATISAGANNVVINAPKLTPHSQVIITFTSDYRPASKYWVVKNSDQKLFTVFTNYPLNNDTTLDWLIIN